VSRHDFMTAVAEFADGSLQAVAYCPRCTLLVPVGVHFVRPCRPASPPLTDIATAWPTPPRGEAH
jgi:hypothetical protein